MNETILHAWFRRVWSEGDRSAVDELLAPDAVIHELTEFAQDARGRAEFLAFFERFRSAMPDSRIEVHDAIAAGDRVAGRWTATATHTGDHLGIPATRKVVRVTGMSVARIENGMIAEAWNVWDRLGFMEQLGFKLAPASEAGAAG